MVFLVIGITDVSAQIPESIKSTIQLSVNDNNGLTDTDKVVITVNATS